VPVRVCQHRPGLAGDPRAEISVAGALRGVSLIDLANLSVTALQVVLPRITEPTLTAHDIANMDPADLLAVGAEVGAFLVSKADRLSVSPTK